MRISVCHCLACQKRSGSAFATQVRFDASNVAIDGQTREYVRTADSGRHVTYLFCPECGSNVAYRTEVEPHLLAVPFGCFDDANFDPPSVSFYERRRLPWAKVVSPDMTHSD